MPVSAEPASGRSTGAWPALAWLVGLLPWHALGWIGTLFGWVAGSVLRIRRQHVESAMLAAGIAAPARNARAMYRSLGISAGEFLWLASRGAEALAHVQIDPGSRVAWIGALSRGRGVVLAASHTGNWDLGACAVAQEIHLLVITKHLTARSLDAFWQSTRASHGVSLAPASGAVGRAREVLRAGGAVAMMMDQVPGSKDHALCGTFLGASAWLARGPAVVAARNAAPLVVTACRRDERGAHRLHVLAVLEPPFKATRAWVDDATRAASRALDEFVRAHPDQWLWLHRRWKEPEASRVDPAVHDATLERPCKTRSSSQVDPFTTA